MSYVMICAGLAGRTREGEPPPVGQFLKSYDPQARDGQGEAAWTTDLAEALRFASVAAVHRCWTQVPRNRLLRADGQLNRPLTAFTITVASDDDRLLPRTQ